MEGDMQQALLAIQATLGQIVGRLDGLDAKVSGLDAKFNGLDAKFNGLAMEFVKFEDRITRRFDDAVETMKAHYAHTVEAAEAARDARRMVMSGPEVFKAVRGDLDDHELRIGELERKTRSLPEA